MKRIIGVVSGKGGVGKTTLVANVGLSLLDFNKDVVVLDADLSTSNLGLHLGIHQFPVDIQDVLEKRIDIMDALYIHPTGLKMIPASISLKYFNKSPEYYRLRSIFTNIGNLVLIDSPPGLEEGAYAVLKACDEALIVTNPDIPAITDSLKVVQIAKKMGKDITGIVFNRVRKESYEIRAEEMERACNIPVIGNIPEDSMIRKSISEKVPLVHYKPYSPASIAFKRIAANIAGLQYNPPKFLGMRRLFGRFR
jgi:septum site-determining protein MinD